MPRSELSILVTVVLAAFVAAAEAGPTRDERTTTVDVTVRRRPGERQVAVGKLPAGTDVVVEAEQGRWLRVRAGRITGYVTRTTLSASKAAALVASANDETATATRISTEPVGDRERPQPTSWRTARDREAASALLATITVSSAALRAEPRAAARKLASIANRARVVVVDARTTPGWIAVRDGDGHTGWIAAHELGDTNDGAVVDDSRSGPTGVSPTANAKAAPARPAAAAVQTRSVGEPRRAWSLHLAAGAGYRASATAIEAAGVEEQVAASATVARLQVDAAVSPVRVLSIGVDARADLGRTASHVDGAASAIHATRGLSAGVRIGLRSRGLAALSLRAGMRRETAELIDGTGTTDELAGTTAGVRLDVLPPGSRLSARVEIDTLVVGTWQRDAAMPDPARATWAGMTVGVRIVGGVSLQAAFEMGRASTTWTQMTATETINTQRIDTSQLFQVGLSGAL